MTRRATLAAAAVLMLAACTGVDPTVGTTLGEADVAQTAAGLGDAFEGMIPELQEEEAAAALAAFPGFAVFPVVVTGADTSLSPQVEAPVPQPLPRGIYGYDTESFAWVEVGTSDDLEYRWTFPDADSEERGASLFVDWGMTAEVEDAVGGLVEVPTAMNATLSADAVEVASVDAEFTWYTEAACPNGVLQPSRIYVDGSLGTDATLSLNDVTVTLSGDEIASSGEVVAASGSARVGFDWDVSLAGTIQRVDCFVNGFEATSGTIGLSVFREAPDGATSVGFAGSFDEIVLDPDSGQLVSIDIDGSIEIDGAAALTFTGTLDGADGGGIPGENVTLVFSNGESTTLAAFIENHLMATTTAVFRVASLFR